MRFCQLRQTSRRHSSDSVSLLIGEPDMRAMTRLPNTSFMSILLKLGLSYLVLTASPENRRLPNWVFDAAKPEIPAPHLLA